MYFGGLQVPVIIGSTVRAKQIMFRYIMGPQGRFPLVSIHKTCAGSRVEYRLSNFNRADFFAVTSWSSLKPRTLRHPEALGPKTVGWNLKPLELEDPTTQALDLWASRNSTPEIKPWVLMPADSLNPKSPTHSTTHYGLLQLARAISLEPPSPHQHKNWALEYHTLQYFFS